MGTSIRRFHRDIAALVLTNVNIVDEAVAKHPNVQEPLLVRAIATSQLGAAIFVAAAWSQACGAFILAEVGEVA